MHGFNFMFPYTCGIQNEFYSVTDMYVQYYITNVGPICILITFTGCILLINNGILIANLMQSRQLPHLHQVAKLVQIYFFIQVGVTYVALLCQLFLRACLYGGKLYGKASYSATTRPGYYRNL